MLSDTDENHIPSIRLKDIEKNGPNCGFKLTRSKWDPYPWVSSVDSKTPAEAAGLKPGDCVLEVNGEDVIGLKISEIAEIVKSNNVVSLLLWNAGSDVHCNPETICCGPMPTNFQRLSACVTTVLAFLECPICLETISPPTYQCENGHLICIRCRTKSEKCPICRIKYGRGRSLVADKIYNSLVEAFELQNETSEVSMAKMQEIFKIRTKLKNIPDIKTTLTPTNKFLSKIIGKSSSVENLSREQDLRTCNLKSKSLSIQEIFDYESPVISRSGSTSRLRSRNKLNTDKCYYGSLEFVQRNTDEEIVLYCPFSDKCPVKIKEDSIIKHFEGSHQGPLVQYFQPQVKVSYTKILETQNLSYLIKDELNLFFLTVELDMSNMKNIILWTWYVGSKFDAMKYKMKATVTCETLPESILSVSTNVFSLTSVSYSEIKECKKGLSLGLNILKSLNIPKNHIWIEIQIFSNDN